MTLHNYLEDQVPEQEEKMEEQGIFKRIGEWVKARWGKVKDWFDWGRDDTELLIAIVLWFLGIGLLLLSGWGIYLLAKWLISLMGLALMTTRGTVILCVILLAIGFFNNLMETLGSLFGSLVKGFKEAKEVKQEG